MVALVAALVGCTDAEVQEAAPLAVNDSEIGHVRGPPGEGDTVGADIGWVSEVAAQPAAFASLLETGKTGWVAYHAHEYPKAIAAFPTDPLSRSRAELSLGILYDDLSRFSGMVNEQLFVAWSTRAGLPPGTDAPMVAALAAHCSMGDTAGGWAAKVKGGPDQPIAMAVGLGRAPFDVSTNGPFGRRMAVHRQVRSSGDPEPLRAAALQPVVTLPQEGFVRTFWDPCVYRTLADLWIDRGVRDAAAVQPVALPGVSVNGVQAMDDDRWRKLDALVAPSAGLAARLFAPWPTTADLRADLATTEHIGLLGAQSPSLRPMGVGTSAWPSDNPEAAKEEVRLLDAAIEALQRKLTDQADPEGLSVVNDLRLTHRFRQEWLTVRARQALALNHPRRALAYVELARDYSSRLLGPENSPSLFALTAEARLELGHTREALDALHLLTSGYPEVIGLLETTGDLAVLQGLDRTGVSKEE